MLNGRQARLLVDTGAGNTCVDRAFAHGLNAPVVQHASMKGLGGGHTPMKVLWVERLQVGDLPPRPQRVGTFDLADLNTAADRAAGVEVAGILGADYLSHTSATIDYGRRVLTLRNPDADSLRRRLQLQGRWRSTAATRGGRRLAVTATLTVRGDRASVTYDGPVSVRAYTGRMVFFPQDSPTRFAVNELELLDPPFRASRYRFGPFHFQTVEDPIRPFAGRYEFAAGGLVMLLPSDLLAGRPEPPELSAAASNDGFDRITFTRDDPVVR
jgi:hypothetical protein